MNRSLRIAAIVFALVASGCGGGGSSTTPTAPSPPANVLAVAGTYPTRATLVADRNSCGSVTVQDNPTTVAHTPGARDVALTHAGTTYRGTVETNGRFSTSPTTLNAADGIYTITITGQFTVSGFTATVELSRASTATCAYAVNWEGTKQGAPNTIPG